ncbi:MAG: DUF6879 family protein [Pseudonocardiales bacterium]
MIIRLRIPVNFEEPLDHDMTTDPDVVEACAKAFEKAWAIAIPHHEYTPS